MYRHFLGRASHVERDRPQGQPLSRRQNYIVLSIFLESGRLDRNDIAAGKDLRKDEIASAVAHGCSHLFSVLAFQGDLRAGYRCAGRIEYGRPDLTSQTLRERLLLT